MLHSRGLLLKESLCDLNPMPNPTQVIPEVCVASLCGSYSNLGDAIVRSFEWGAQPIHTEIWCRDTSFTAIDGLEKAVYGSTLGGCMPFMGKGRQWKLTPLDVTDVDKFWDFLCDTTWTTVPYSISIIDCMMPNSLLNYIDQDEDCMNPLQWNSVYCSQYCLLALRWCARSNLFNKPADVLEKLWSMHSKKCLPYHAAALAEYVSSDQVV